MDRASEKTVRAMHAEVQNSRFPGWAGLNARHDARFLQTWEAHDTLNWGNRTGVGADDIGVLATRMGFSRNTKYEFLNGNVDAVATYGMIRLLAKFFPGVAAEADQLANQKGQVLRLVQTEAGALKTKFQKWDGTTWSNITTGLAGSVDDALGVNLFPQSITLGLPTPRFVWGDIVNGVYVYDGTTATQVSIPKNTDSATNITGALWFEQINGRLVVAGNYVDAGEDNVVYYSAPNAPTDFTSAGGGGSVIIYGADSRSGASAPKRIMGIAEWQGMLVAFSEDMRHVIAGLGTDNQQIRSFPGEGAFNGKCIVKYGDALYWWGKDGAYEWNGGEPTKLSDGIWNKVGNISKVDTLIKGFSFVYNDQWWTTVQYRASGVSGITVATGSFQDTNQANNKFFYNWVFDFKTKQWYIYDVPMVAAFSSKGGTDVGLLYFASPVQVAANTYHTYVYGFDEASGNTIYADDVRDSSGSGNAGDYIYATWETGKNDWGNVYLKDFYTVHAEIGVTQSTGITKPNGSTGNARFSAGRVQFRTDLNAAYQNLNFSQASPTPLHQLGYPGSSGTNIHVGQYIQHRWDVAAVDQVIVRYVYVEYMEKGIPVHEG